MNDLHLELANLYYPDVWGASMERWASEQEYDQARKPEENKRALYSKKLWEKKAYSTDPAYKAKRIAKNKAYREANKEKLNAKRRDEYSVKKAVILAAQKARRATRVSAASTQAGVAPPTGRA